MAGNEDDDRIRRKAHQLWEAEGRPHGRDADHWAEAREIIAIEDSNKATLLPRDFGAEEPIEEAEEALRNLADFPNLTDQGENLLTSTDREPGPVPSVEVPTSDQPGVPQKAARGPSGASAAKPAKAAAKPEATKAKPAAAAPKPAATKPAPAKPAAPPAAKPTPASKKPKA